MKKIKRLLCYLDLHHWDNKAVKAGDVDVCNWCNCFRTLEEVDVGVTGLKYEWSETQSETT